MPPPPPPALPGVPLTLVAADGERLAAWHVPPPAGPGAYEIGVVLLHGFTGTMARHTLQAVARALAPYAGVLLVDTRGHGGSTGLSTLGDREVLDVDAAVAAARDLGYSRVVAMGSSMGGTAVLRHAALVGEPVHGYRLGARPDAVVALSTTSAWAGRDNPALRRLHWLATTRVGRLVARRLGARVDPRGWDPAALPASPVDLVARIAPVPLLVVHGDSDEYFGLEHPRALAAAAGGAVELWLVPGLGHGENALERDRPLLDRLGRHLPVLLDRRG